MIERLTQAAQVMAYPQLALWPAVITLVILCPLAWSLATALQGSRALAVASAVCLSAAVTVTTARPGLGSATADWSRVDSVCVVTNARTLSPEAVLNLLLLVPFAALAVLAVGRPILVALFAGIASLGIEAVQAAYSVGACDSSDLVRNSTGALVAALVAAAVRPLLRMATAPAHPTPTPTSRWDDRPWNDGPWNDSPWNDGPRTRDTHETQSEVAGLPVSRAARTAS